MPIYEYKCADCGVHLEKMQKVSDAPLTVCENCGGRLEKQLSLSAFQFKGEGWYVTDYSNKLKDGKSEKKSSAESTAKTETASNSSKDSGADSKTESVSKKD